MNSFVPVFESAWGTLHLRDSGLSFCILFALLGGARRCTTTAPTGPQPTTMTALRGASFFGLFFYYSALFEALEALAAPASISAGTYSPISKPFLKALGLESHHLLTHLKTSGRPHDCVQDHVAPAQGNTSRSSLQLLRVCSSSTYKASTSSC